MLLIIKVVFLIGATYSPEPMYGTSSGFNAAWIQESGSLITPSAIIPSFQVEDNTRWNHTSTANGIGGSTQGDPILLTWSVVPDGTPISPAISGESSDPSSLEAWLPLRYGSLAAGLNILEQSLEVWETVSGVEYERETNDDGDRPRPGGGIDGTASPLGDLGTRGDVRIGGHSIDGQAGSNVLAYNYFPNHGDMVIDTDNTSFYGNSTNSYRGSRNVYAHEAGHGIGIEHVFIRNGAAGATDALMEPFISTAFDGVLHDDILAANRHYGDPLERDNSYTGNNTFGNPTDLGSLSLGSSDLTTLSGSAVLSIDDGEHTAGSESDPNSNDDGLLNADHDYFKFSIATPMILDATLDPIGFTYEQSEQSAGGGVVAYFNFNSEILIDLEFEVLNSVGATIATADSQGAGIDEVLSGLSLSTPGDYYLHIHGVNNLNQFTFAHYDGSTFSNPQPVQLYDMSITLTTAAVPEPSTYLLFAMLLSPLSARTTRTQAGIAIAQ